MDPTDAPIELGTASAAPGEVDRGWLDVADLPTGTAERLPVIVANGVDPGPTLWLTGGVHGDEATGVAVVLDTVEALSTAADGPRPLDDLAGCVVAVPVVSPAGVRRNARHTYYGDEDPNRHFPDADHESARPPALQERIDTRLYEAIVGGNGVGDGDRNAGDRSGDGRSGDDRNVDDRVSADALIDCHTAGVASEPFAIRDRVLYGDRRTEREAEQLAGRLEAIVDAFGFPTLTEYPAAEYVEETLQRSLAGAVLNEAGIPAFTAELGAHSVVDDRLAAGGVAGTMGVVVELGLLDEASIPERVGVPGDHVDPAPVEFPVRRYRGPVTDAAGLVRHRVEAGESFEAGDVLASVVAANGASKEPIRAEHDGYVIARAEGLAVYEGDPITSLAIRDDGELVVPRERGDEGE